MLEKPDEFDRKLRDVLKELRPKHGFANRERGTKPVGHN